MKNSILFVHPVIGEITFQDLINDIEQMIEDASLFEDIVNEILKNTNMSLEDASTLFNLSVLDRLKWILFLLKDLN